MEMEFIGTEKAIELPHDTLVICKCFNWCEEGYQVAKWNGEEFKYDSQPNNMFNGCVVGFVEIKDLLEF